MVNAAFTALVMLVSAVGLVVDDRTLAGESVWLKPLKFGFAFTLYGLTLAWLLSKLRKGRRVGWWTGLAHAVFSFFDIAVIAAAAALGTYSHFNTGTDSFNTLVQAVFSYGVPPILLSNVVVAVLVLVQRDADRALNVAIRAGVLLATAGMLVIAFLGPFMDPSPRTALDAAGGSVELTGGHGIGDAGGHGMALTNWNADGGDIRVPHFVGLHGIHVLLLLAVLLGGLAARRAWLRDDKVRARLMTTAALAYTGVFGVAAWQAGRGQSVVRPDTATWTALGAIALIATVATALIRFAAVRRLAR